MSTEPSSAQPCAAKTISQAGSDMLQAVAELTAQQNGMAAAAQAVAGATAFGVGFLAAYLGTEKTRSLLLQILEGCGKIDHQAAAAITAQAIKKAGGHG